MANQSKKRLCGGTFLVLLLDAKGKRQTTRSNGRKGDGRNNPDVFERLLKITIPDFIRPTEGRTFNTFTTEYKNCRESDTPSVCLTYDETIHRFDSSVRNNYQEVATAFDKFVKYAVDVPTHGKRLVASLLDLINMDDISGTQEFFIRPDGTAVSRDDILNEEQYCLSSFILGVWHYIVCNVKDNETKECKETIEYLLGPKGETHAGREVNCNIGLSTIENITVTFDLPYKKNERDHKEGAVFDTHHTNMAHVNANGNIERNEFDKVKISYKGGRLTPDMEQTFLSWNPTIIDLNCEPNAYLLNSNRNAKFVMKTTCRLSFEMAPDCTLQIKVCFTIDDTEFSGFTSSDNWNSQSYVNNLVSVGEYNCLVWFKVLNPTAANPQVQFYMIGEPDE